MKVTSELRYLIPFIMIALMGVASCVAGATEESANDSSAEGTCGVSGLESVWRSVPTDSPCELIGQEEFLGKLHQILQAKDEDDCQDRFMEFRDSITYRPNAQVERTILDASIYRITGEQMDARRLLFDIRDAQTELPVCVWEDLATQEWDETDPVVLQTYFELLINTEIGIEERLLVVQVLFGLWNAEVDAVQSFPKERYLEVVWTLRRLGMKATELGSENAFWAYELLSEFSPRAFLAIAVSILADDENIVLPTTGPILIGLVEEIPRECTPGPLPNREDTDGWKYFLIENSSEMRPWLEDSPAALERTPALFERLVDCHYR